MIDLTAAEVADELGVSRSVVNRLCLLGRLRAYDVGTGTQKHRWRITDEI